MEMRSSPQPVPLTMEVCLHAHVSIDTASLDSQLRNFFSDRTLLCNDHEVTASDLDEELAASIRTIYIAYPSGVDADGRPRLFWWEVLPQFYFYTLFEEGPVEVNEEEESCSFSREWRLPALEFRDFWRHLHFDDDLKPRLLRYVETAMAFSAKGVHHDIVAWNRLVLLHGPPGTGKTSLCKALAQKLSIRHQTTYGGGIALMEVNTHSLFSKYFSESGKLVAQLFEKIHELLQSRDVLLFVLIDEVESLTAARKSAVGGSEPSDALRAVNALLTQLDRLQRCPNVVVMTTSNVTEAIDDAFLDRADMKTYVGPPGYTVRYRILMGCLEELQRVGLVEVDQEVQTMDLDVAITMARCSVKTSIQGSCSSQELLHQCAALAENFSCRTLKKIPFLAYAHQDKAPPLSCSSYLAALRSAIEAEAVANERLNTARVN